MACVNMTHTSDVTGECQGMLTPERLNIPYKAFNDTELAEIHNKTIPSGVPRL